MLKLFLDYSKNEDSVDPAYFVYEEPTNIPVFKNIETAVTRVKSDNKTSTNARRTNGDRSRRRRTDPKKTDESGDNLKTRNKASSPPARKTRFSNEGRQQDRR